MTRWPQISTPVFGHSARRRQVEAEPTGESDHGTAITIPWQVPTVVFELQLGTQARNNGLENLSLREPLGGIGAIRSVRRRPDLPPGPIFGERDRMEIDLSAMW